MLRALSFAALVVAAVSATPVHAASRQKVVFTEPGELPQLKVAGDAPLPLEHTSVKAEISGFVARVEVRQSYGNPSKDPLEAIYTFPLPENSAVDDMRIRIGDREIRADIKKRDEARKTYETARNNGQTAALLEQERPNVFTQSVANIPPGEHIDVVVSYVQTLSYDAGTYEFVFPMVVGPRFNPPGAAIAAQPPYFGEGERNGHDIAVDVTVRAGMPIKGFDVPTHHVNSRTDADGTMHLTLDASDRIPNRDFVLHYDVAAAKPQLAVLTHSAGGGSGGELALVVQPPELDVDLLVGSREILFVVDISGSMHGVPLAMCKDAMREALRKLRPVDTFNVFTFAGSTGKAFDAPRPANDANVLQGTRFVDGLEAGGGTMMADAVDTVLSSAVEKGRHRYVFFMTDGYVGNETEILAKTEALVKKQKATTSARVFGFGVGSSVNRMLLDGLGKAGDGATVYASTREDPALAVNTFFRRIDKPVIENLKIDWGNAQVSDVYPSVLPDLFASRPTIVHARFSGKADTTVTVSGTVNGKPVSITQKLVTSAKDDGQSLGSLWARSKVESLERQLWSGRDEKIVEAITQVGLEHRLVTAYTSFVAVDSASHVDGKLTTVNQPAHAPEGVDMEYAAPAAQSYLSRAGSGSGSGAPMRERRMYAPSPAGAPSPKKMKAEYEESDVRKPEPARDDKDANADALTVAPGLDKKAVRSALDANAAAIEKVLAKAGFHGTLKLRWFVTSQGSALQCKLVSGSLDAQTTKELIAVITAMTFPASSQGSARVDFVIVR